MTFMTLMTFLSFITFMRYQTSICDGIIPGLKVKERETKFWISAASTRKNYFNLASTHTCFHLTKVYHSLRAGAHFLNETWPEPENIAFYVYCRILQIRRTLVNLEEICACVRVWQMQKFCLILFCPLKTESHCEYTLNSFAPNLKKVTLTW